MKDRQTLSLLPLLAPILALGEPGCASAPDFRPSKPIRETASLNEALLVCSEYQMPVPAERPVTLKPFVECAREAADAHPPTPGNGFRVFEAELSERFRDLRESAWTPRLGAQIEVAIHALLRTFWRGESAPNGKSSPYTSTERDEALHHFPRTSAEVRARDWVVSPKVELDPELERFKALLGAELAETEPLLSDQPSSSKSDLKLCESLAHLREDSEYLSSVAHDLRDVEKIDPKNEISGVLRDRYRARLGAATRKLSDLRERIAAARKQGFRTSNCTTKR